MKDTLILDSIVRQSLGISNTTMWRWDNDPVIGFPKPIYIRGRKFRDSEQLDEWRKRMSANAGVMDATRQRVADAKREKAVKRSRQSAVEAALGHDAAQKARKRKAA